MKSMAPCKIALSKFWSFFMFLFEYFFENTHKYGFVMLSQHSTVEPNVNLTHSKSASHHKTNH